MTRTRRATASNSAGLCRGIAIGALWAIALAAAAQPGPPGFALREGPVVLHAGTKCLDVNEPQVRSNGARVQLWDCDGRPSQVWRFERGRIVSLASGRCLDVHGPDAGFNGARVQVYDCNGSPNQAWRYERGLLVGQVDGRCLDVHAPDVDRNAAHVQTWDCHGAANQQWGVEPVAPAARDVEAGPIWSTDDANQKCPAVCSPARWNGQWHTTVPGTMSVCNCVAGGPPWPQPAPGGAVPPVDAGPRPMGERRFEEFMRTMDAEPFPRGKMGVVESAARDNWFFVAQLRRIVDALTFPSDKMRAVEIVAPRVVDRENAFSLLGAFTFDSEKEQARKIFERLK
jgi:hypothetical protein